MLCAIPIETITRELDGALYLTLHLAKRSLPTLLGERMVNKILGSHQYPVIYFDIDHEPSHNRMVLDKGGKVLSIHPEGVNIFDSPTILSQFTSIIGDVTDLCVWGQAQADLVMRNVDERHHGKVKGIGHPSFDLASPRFVEYYASREIVDEHGDDYILVNTNFSYGNNLMGFERWLEMVSRSENLKFFRQEQHIKFVHALADYHLKLIDHYVGLVKTLSEEFPEKHIILRPHPSEDPQLYRDAFRGSKNVFVSKEGSVRKWLASAGSVIHHDCTTGIEALLMGRRVINFRPIFNEDVAAPIPAKVGYQTRTPSEVTDFIRSGNWTEEFRQKQLETMVPYFATISHSAAKSLSDLAASYAAGQATRLPDTPDLKMRMENYGKYASRRTKAGYPAWLFPDKRRKAINALGKFPRLTKKIIEEQIDSLRRMEPDLPAVEVRELCLNTFIISPS
jgi:surface carbohydrate biosynthesis protein